MDRDLKIARIAFFAMFALFLGTTLNATLFRIMAQNEMAARDAADQRAIVRRDERENALRLAEQYKAEYQAAVFEIADLKAENEALTAALDELTPDEPEFDYDFDCVVRVVGAECRGEPFEGILAVCQCIADTAERTGMTPEEVVKAPGQYARPVDRATIDGMENVNEACLLVFGQGYRPHEEFIEYFYAADTYSAWHENSLQYCFTVGGHRFFKAVGA